MQVEPQVLLGVMGIMITLAFQTWVVVSFLLNRADRDKKELTDRMDADKKEITTRLDADKDVVLSEIAKIRDVYMRKDDADKEVSRLYRTLTDFKVDLSNQVSTINSRLDSIINAISARKVT